MAVKRLDDDRVVIDDMRNCPFCGQQMAIQYIPSRHLFRVTHAEANETTGACALARSVIFEVEGVSSFRNAIEKWNRRADG